MSTSPTLMSWRRKSSVRKFPSSTSESYVILLKLRCDASSPVRVRLDSSQPKPVRLVRPQRKQIWQLADAGKKIIAEHLDQDISLIAPQIQFDSLCGTGKIVDHQDALIAEPPQVSQYSMIRWIKKFNRPPAEHGAGFANCDDALHPVKERMFALSLSRDIYRGIPIDRIMNQRSI